MKKNKMRLNKNIVSKIYTIIGILAIMFVITFTASITVTSFSKPIEASASNYIQITVAPGDTLWDIAQDYHTDGDIRNYIIEIKKINNLENANVFVDQMLYIPIKDY